MSQVTESSSVRGSEPDGALLAGAYLTAAALASVVSLGAGFLYSLTFLESDLFSDISFLSAGRLRMVHTSLVLHGFLVNAFFAGMCWCIPRIGGAPLVQWGRVDWALFGAWQLGLVLSTLGILAGQAQGVEWAESPRWLDPFVLIVQLGLIGRFVDRMLRTPPERFYVSLWYFLLGSIWLVATSLILNLLPQYVFPGSAGNAVFQLSVHELMGLAIAPLGLGLVFYFWPRVVGRPLFSHALALFSVWTLIIFYPIHGLQLFVRRALPSLSFDATIALAIILGVSTLAVFANLFLTAGGRWRQARRHPAFGWWAAGIVFYFLTSLQIVYQSTETARETIAYTDWIVSHSHLAMFGVFGFWFNGMVVMLWPRLCGRAWFFGGLNRAAFWVVILAFVLLVVDLMAAGLVQGSLWKTLAPWEESLVASGRFWLLRTVFGFTWIVGQLMVFVNMWWTARFGQR